jgi:hypothetical protein
MTNSVAPQVNARDQRPCGQRRPAIVGFMYTNEARERRSDAATRAEHRPRCRRMGAPSVAAPGETSDKLDAFGLEGCVRVTSAPPTPDAPGPAVRRLGRRHAATPAPGLQCVHVAALHIQNADSLHWCELLAPIPTARGKLFTREAHMKSPFQKTFPANGRRRRRDLRRAAAAWLRARTGTRGGGRRNRDRHPRGSRDQRRRRPRAGRGTR